MSGDYIVEHILKIYKKLNNFERKKPLDKSFIWYTQSYDGKVAKVSHLSHL